VLDVAVLGRTVRIVNTHLNVLFAERHRKHRLAQVMELLDSTEAICDDFEFIICGDLNMHDDQEELELFFNRAALTDAFRLMNPWDKGATWSAQNHLTRGWMRTSDMRIDYVFFDANKDLDCSSCQLCLADAPFSSDHFGVIADFFVKGSRECDVEVRLEL
jgi:endonuclease/exonuclease/phosphatase family metal-dependent hydrolase